MNATQQKVCLAMVMGLMLVALGCQPNLPIAELEQPLTTLNLDDAELVRPAQPVVAKGEADGEAANAEQVTTADMVFAEDQQSDAERQRELFAPRNRMTIRGAVLGKRYVKLGDGHTGVIVELQPGGDFVDVLIGTTRFNEHHDINVGIADRIMVTGPMVVVDSQQLESRRLLLANEIVWRDHTIRLRDDDGVPLWHEPDEED